MMFVFDNIIGNNGFEGWGVVIDLQMGVFVFYMDGEDVFNVDYQFIIFFGGLGVNLLLSQVVVVVVNFVCFFDQYYIFFNLIGVFNGNIDGLVIYWFYMVGSGFLDVQFLFGLEVSSKVGEGMMVILSKIDFFIFWLVVCLLIFIVVGLEYVVYEINEMGIFFNDVYIFGFVIIDNFYLFIMNMIYMDDGSVEYVVVGFFVFGLLNCVFINIFNIIIGIFGVSVNVVVIFSVGILYDFVFLLEGNYIYYVFYFFSCFYQVLMGGGMVQ